MLIKCGEITLCTHTKSPYKVVRPMWEGHACLAGPAWESQVRPAGPAWEGQGRPAGPAWEGPSVLLAVLFPFPPRVTALRAAA